MPARYGNRYIRANTGIRPYNGWMGWRRGRSLCLPVTAIGISGRTRGFAPTTGGWGGVGAGPRACPLRQPTYQGEHGDSPLQRVDGAA
ncbi:MAG: hypothetical protein V8K32_08625 [Candidatus Electrothrix gigas]